MVAQLDRVDASAVAVQDGVADPDPARRQIGSRADGDRVRGGVGGEHVERLRRGDADPAPLADREVVVAAMAADRLAGAIEHRALALAEAAVAAQEPRLALAGEEAEVLALGLLGDGEAVAGGDLAHLGLAQLGQREAQPVQHRRRQRGEHVALVLVAVRGGGEQRTVAVLDDPRVVAGDEVVGAEPLGEVDHRRDPHLAVADDAGVGGGAGSVAVEEGADDAAAELLLEVEGEVRDAERVGDRPGAEHRLRRAAGLGPVGLGVGPELQGDAEHLRPTLAFEQRGDGAVDAARHRDEDRGRSAARRVAATDAAALASARCSASAASCAAWRLAGRQSTDRRVDLVDPDPRRIDNRLPVDHLGDGRRGRPRRPTALGVEAHGGDPPVLDRRARAARDRRRQPRRPRR